MKHNMKKFTKFLILFTLLGLFNCRFLSQPTNFEEVQTNLKDIERYDHQLCLTQDIDFEKWTDVSAEIYWRCRYNLMQDKMVNNQMNPADVENNAKMAEINDNILKNLQKARKAVLVGIEDNPEQTDHLKCNKMGFVLDPKNQNMNEAYYQCRKNLITDRSPPPPGITSDVSNFQPTASMNSANKTMPGVKIAQHPLPPSPEVDFTINRMKQYPNCMNLNVKSKIFDKCVAAQKESLFCLENIRTVNAKKQLDDKIYCQRQSLLQFPDNYTLTRNKSAKEIEDMLKKEREDEIAEERAKQERELTRTRKFFGESYASQDKIFSDESDAKNIKQRQSEREIMFNKIQILELREEFIVKCNQMLEQKLPDIIQMERRKCLDMGKNWYDIEGE